ncbi:hypothetical protein [Streptomyces sp. NPDC057199]|uniref:hypothetical protein n=1 Tax=Streptomyces sp. NPDC057199 TaxID=3346047 RepID=UPI00364077AC
MRRFLGDQWRRTPQDGPDADRIRGHRLWLPHDQPQALAHCARIREILDLVPDGDVRWEMAWESVAGLPLGAT